MVKFLILLLAPCISAIVIAQEPIEVGVAFRFQEKYDSTISQFMQGVEAAKEIFEKERGVQFVFKKFSYGESLESRVEAAKRIVKSKVAVVLGTETSDEALAIGEILNHHSIVMLTPTASNPRVTAGRPFVFRACFSDDVVAERFAVFVFENLKPKKLGVFRNVSFPYSDFLSDRFAAKYSELKGSSENVFVEKTVKNSTDLEEIIQRFKAAGVDTVSLFSFDTDLMRFYATAAKLGFFPRFIGSDGWGANDFVQARVVKGMNLGKKFVGYRNIYWKEDEVSPLAAKFIKLHQERHSERPNTYSAMGFDAAWVLFDGMMRSGNPKNAELVRQALLKTSLKDLVTSKTFSFGENQTPKRDLYIYRISGEGTHFEATLK